LIPSDPVDDTTGRYKTYQTSNKFQASMLEAPFAGGFNTFCW
jgi:hypothetical protein